jgi:hypothetical protein
MSPALKMAKTISFPPAESELILTLPRKTAIKHCPGDPFGEDLAAGGITLDPSIAYQSVDFIGAELSQ